MKLKPIPASKGISVLYGHRVLPDIPKGITPYSKTTITPAFLDDFLKRHADWQALSIHDMQTGNYHSDTPAFALTFDDGYRDNLIHLLPVLEKYDVHAAIYICTAFCTNKSQPLEHDFGSRLQSNQHGVYHKHRHSLKRGALWWRRLKLNKLIQQYDLPSASDETEFLNAYDIEKLSNHLLITFGHHTKTHPLLSRAMPWTVWSELQSDYNSIAYPYGGQNIIVRMIARLNRYRTGFTTEERLYNRDKDSALAIPRIELKMD